MLSNHGGTLSCGACCSCRGLWDRWVLWVVLLAPQSCPGFGTLGLFWGLAGCRGGGQLGRWPGRKQRSLGKPV